MRIETYHDFVLVDLSEDMTGISSLDSSQKIARQGKVVAVGPGRLGEHTEALRVPISKTGQQVLVEPYLGTNVYENGKHYLMVRDENVMGIIREATNE